MASGWILCSGGPVQACGHRAQARSRWWASESASAAAGRVPPWPPHQSSHPAPGDAIDSERPRDLRGLVQGPGCGPAPVCGGHRGGHPSHCPGQPSRLAPPHIIADSGAPRRRRRSQRAEALGSAASSATTGPGPDAPALQQAEPPTRKAPRGPGTRRDGGLPRSHRRWAWPSTGPAGCNAGETGLGEGLAQLGPAPATRPGTGGLGGSQIIYRRPGLGGVATAGRQAHGPAAGLGLHGRARKRAIGEMGL